MQYEAVIGSEVHVELATNTKLFCGCSIAFGAAPNTQTCPVCLGMPGVLPVMNRVAFEYSLRIALALNCQVDPVTTFDRKNYYYPDLPKNYQISQSYQNLGREGWLDIPVHGALQRVGIWNVHLEEDAGKLVHPDSPGAAHSLVDLNRAGTPLLEIVSAPDMRSSAEVDAFMRTLRSILLYTGVSDCKMQEGRLRFEPSISLRPVGQKEYGARVEVKNVGSISAVVKAVDFEIDRQTRALNAGETIHQETRLWDERLGRTVSMRRKETSADYRYFPEPDLVQVRVSEEWKEQARKAIPELPVARRLRFQKEFGLGEYEAGVITDDRALADYFEACLAAGGVGGKSVANILINDVLRWLNESGRDIAAFRDWVPPWHIAELATNVESGRVNTVLARAIFAKMIAQIPAAERASGDSLEEEPTPSPSPSPSPNEIIEQEGLAQVSDESAIAEIVDRVLAANPKSVADYRAGKTAAFNALIGPVMRETRGKANPQVVREVLQQRLAGQ